MPGAAAAALQHATAWVAGDDVQDRALALVDHLLGRVEEQRLAAAGRPGRARPAGPASEQAGVEPGSVDRLLLRAPNRGVVPYEEAVAALARSAEVLRPGGLAVPYGWSMPLPGSAHLRAAGRGPGAVVADAAAGGVGPAHPVPFYLAEKPADAGHREHVAPGKALAKRTTRWDT